MCKDIILETCALVQEAQASHPFRYSGGMTTNGYLLDEDAFRQYYAAGITDYQVTLVAGTMRRSRPRVRQRDVANILKQSVVLSLFPRSSFLP